MTPDADFAARCSVPGFVRGWNGANFLAGVPDTFLAPVGCVSGGQAPFLRAVIDSAVGLSGGGAMRFDVPASGVNRADGFQDPSGYWFGNFSDDLSVQFGENSQFYVQVRIRFNDVLANSLYYDTSGGPTGPKLVDIAPGDQKGGPLPNPKDGVTHYYTSDISKLVCIPYPEHRMPIMYHYSPNKTSGYANLGMFENIGGDWLMQNMMSACKYTTAHHLPIGASVPGCWTFLADEWFMLKWQIKLGPKALIQQNATTSWEVFSNSEIRLWAAHENEPSQLIFEWTAAHRGYTAGVSAEMPITGYAPGATGSSSNLALSRDCGRKFGKLILMPFMTRRDGTKPVSGLGQVWYGEAIVATQDIPDPASMQADPPPLPEIIMPTAQQQAVLDDAEKTLNDACTEAGVQLSSIPSVAAAITAATAAVQSQLDTANASLATANGKIAKAQADLA